MVQALRSHSRCLVVSSDQMSSCASRSRTFSVTDRRLIVTRQPRCTTRKICCFNFLVIKSRKYFFHLKQKRAIIIANVYSYIRGMQLVLSYGLLTLMKCKINFKKLKKTFCFLICRKFYFMYIRPFNSRPSMLTTYERFTNTSLHFSKVCNSTLNINTHRV